jgi:hypothetical protein
MTQPEVVLGIARQLLRLKEIMVEEMLVKQQLHIQQVVVVVPVQQDNLPLPQLRRVLAVLALQP